MTRAGTIPLSEIERIEIYQNKKRYKESQLAMILKETGGDFLFNGTIFSWTTYKALMPCKSDGITLCNPGYTIWGLAWDGPETFRESVVPCDAANYISCTNLIHHGEKVDKPNYQPDMGGNRPRTAIGVKEGRFAYFVTQGGYTPEKLRDYLYSIGWSCAIMLDGGGSTCFWDKTGGFYCDKGRADQNFIVVHLKRSDNEPKGDKPMIPIYSYSLKKDGDTALSANFKVKEFACNDGTDTIFNAPALVALLQKIRTHYGKPVNIVSGYRTEPYNAKVGGAAYSQHKYGTAADIQISGVTPKAVSAYVETLMPNTGGIGVYGTFTHIDVREVKARWNG